MGDLPVGQISEASRIATAYEKQRNVINRHPEERALARVSKDGRAPCPGRGAAFFTLLRRAGTHSNNKQRMDPGSAAHHAAKSGALRSIRGTEGRYAAYRAVILR